MKTPYTDRLRQALDNKGFFENNEALGLMKHALDEAFLIDETPTEELSEVQLRLREATSVYFNEIVAVFFELKISA